MLQAVLDQWGEVWTLCLPTGHSTVVMTFLKGEIRFFFLISWGALVVIIRQGKGYWTVTELGSIGASALIDQDRIVF